MATKKDVLEVEVVIPQELIATNEDLGKQYDSKNQKLVYEIGPNVPKNSLDELKELLSSSQLPEIISLNPAIITLVEMQKFKELKYDKENEKESVQQFKDAKKAIGSFNSSITKIKGILKEPHISYNKKVDAIFNFFKQESDNTKGALEVNYDEYLKEQERIAKEKEDKKKAAELAQIQELAEKNKEQQEKLLNQQRASKRIEVEGAINKIGFEVNTKVPTLNIDGLQSLKSEILKKQFSSLLSEDEIKEFAFSEDEINQFKGLFTLSIESAERVIDAQISSINNSTKVQSLESENKVLTAEKQALESTTPSSILSGENDMPFSSPKQESAPAPISDIDKFNLINKIISDYDEYTKSVLEKIKEVDFNDDQLKQLQSILTDKSFPQITEWTGKLKTWTSDKFSKYQQIINQ